MLSNDTEKNITCFEREQDSPIFFAYYAADIFFPANPTKKKQMQHSFRIVSSQTNDLGPSFINPQLELLLEPSLTVHH
ncbi:9280_t:CDS:2 [Funneliformis geosporum]|nr:9280_t:CDS:2 [Funneliformis geosporum]